MDSGSEKLLSELGHHLKISADLVLTNYVPDSVLRALYQTTDLFVFPSLYEGFGLPLVEAMACGAPSITSDRSSMREIVGLPEARFDPDTPESIGRAIASALSDEELRHKLHALCSGVHERFSWKHVARRTIDACGAARESALRSSGTSYRRPMSRRRPILALFSPMPPERSGIADYSMRLVRALEPFADVDVFVDGPPARFESVGTRGTQILFHETFPYLDALGRYDEVLYAMGNSKYHASAYEALKLRPGVVLAHEVRFTGFYSWYGVHRSVDPGFFSKAMQTQHPDAPSSLSDKLMVTVEEADRFGIQLVSELLELSKSFLVHSQYAAEIAQNERPDIADHIRKVRFGIPELLVDGPRTELRSPLLVSTFGIPDPLKRSDDFLRAVPHVLRRVPDAHFAVVGEASAEYLQSLRTLTHSLGVQDKVEITGRVSVSEYDAYLRRTSCAVQLRASTNGETSAAIGDCLRSALPTIVSDLGHAREYWGEAVWRIPVHAGEEEIAAAIIEILIRPALAQSLSEGAYSYAQRSSFRQAALSLLAALSLPCSSLGDGIGHPDSVESARVFS
jgi:glycosyltransferase involved in cell wall biosynthesis